ncbi:MAG TPA: BlaI/MecI/CopY family transcriptional regulator [Frankiaceae bacterium]|jgi:predicted transcriptional regulator|nr:BlaI/MecI/CopY family transcriptional regulator [Frankiaceae bacterium]
MAPTGERRRRGALEQQVLACLAMADHPMSPAEVQSELGGDLAYTTVMTTLTRMHAKHALNRDLDGRTYRYSLAGDANGAVANVTAHQMLRLLEGSDRARVLSRFVADLDPTDEEMLARLLSLTGREEAPRGTPGAEGSAQGDAR